MTGLSLLYVDDDPDIRMVVSLALALDPSLSFTVTGSGREALNAIAAGLRPDVAVLDVMMPGMDGPTVLTKLRSWPAMATVPIIFMTAKARAADLDFYRSRGAIGTILKPFDPLTLVQQVRGLLDQCRAAKEASEQ